MTQCVGTNRDGRRYLNGAQAASRYCHRHLDQGLENDSLFMGTGALLGQMAAPGVGGTLGGAAVAKLASWLFADAPARKKKIFVSFDVDNDRALKHLLVGQSLH